jgi:hypothetical protein
MEAWQNTFKIWNIITQITESELQHFSVCKVVLLITFFKCGWSFQLYAVAALVFLIRQHLNLWTGTNKDTNYRMNLHVHIIAPQCQTVYCVQT